MPRINNICLHNNARYVHGRRLLRSGASMYFVILILGGLALVSLSGGLGLSLESIAIRFGIVP